MNKILNIFFIFLISCNANIKNDYYDFTLSNTDLRLDFIHIENNVFIKIYNNRRWPIFIPINRDSNLTIGSDSSNISVWNRVGSINYNKEINSVVLAQLSNRKSQLVNNIEYMHPMIRINPNSEYKFKNPVKLKVVNRKKQMDYISLSVKLDLLYSIGNLCEYCPTSADFKQISGNYFEIDNVRFWVSGVRQIKYEFP